MIRDCRDAGAVPILSTVVGNVRGVEPEADPRREDGGPALASFARAEKAEAAGRWDDARRLYWEALDSSPRRSFGRADDRQNEIVRGLAREESVALVDSVRNFEAASPHGIPGDELFGDGNHPNFAGHRLLARGFTAAIAAIAGEAPTRALDDPRALFQEAGFGPRRQAVAYVVNGVTLIVVSNGHPDPARRLALARANFHAAAALDPTLAWAWLGLALAGCDGISRRDLSWLLDSFRGDNRACAGPEFLGPAIEALRAAGAPASALKRLDALRGRPDLSALCAGS
jgi:hypothetical protein